MRLCLQLQVNNRVQKCFHQQKALLKAMKELKILLNESEENLLIGQYENYLKSFAFLTLNL